MNQSPEIIRRLAARTAAWLRVPSWGGFLYTLWHRPHEISFPVSAALPDVGILTVVTLLCCLITFLCSLSVFADDMASASRTDWGLVLAGVIPFLGMIWLLDPAGMSGGVSGG